MNEWYPLASCIQLRVEGRISEKDAQRQERTARAILQRLANQPGLVLADEVGMGKTFVALAVAASVALSDTQCRPVVVMIPPSLKHKWPDDFRVFAEKCLSPEAAREVRAASADSAVEFLKLLDDPPERRKSIIFLTHGAMHRGLGYGQADSWVKLAVIQRAMKGRHHTTPIRRSLHRCLGKLLWLQWVERRAEDIWEKLLDHTPDQWLRILHRCGIDPEGDANPATDDNPVPQMILKVLRDFDTTPELLVKEIHNKWCIRRPQELHGRRGFEIGNQLRQPHEHLLQSIPWSLSARSPSSSAAIAKPPSPQDRSTVLISPTSQSSSSSSSHSMASSVKRMVKVFP
jgi:hypothetical protein